jgi:hypothetical protein
MNTLPLTDPKFIQKLKFNEFTRSARLHITTANGVATADVIERLMDEIIIVNANVRAGFTSCLNIKELSSEDYRELTRKTQELARLRYEKAASFSKFTIFDKAFFTGMDFLYGAQVKELNYQEIEIGLREVLSAIIPTNIGSNKLGFIPRPSSENLWKLDWETWKALK